MTDLLRHSIHQWASESSFEVADAYKWLFHAALGGEHAVQDPEAARTYLFDEWDSLSAPHADEPIVTPLTPDGRLVRLHLRPYKAHGGSPVALLEAFVRSSAEFPSDKSRFLEAWAELGDALTASPVAGIARADWEAFDEWARSRGYPAVHHSHAYSQANRPAYRVLLKTHATPLLANLSQVSGQ